jgi:hypothetical protein
MRDAVIVLLISIPAQISMCQIPIQVDTIADDMSPQQSIEILHLYDQPLDRYEIWFIDANDSTNVFLFDSTSFQNAVVIFSPNEQWIAENIEVVSNFRTVLLFKRIKGVQYFGVDSSNMYDKAIAFFTKVEHLRRLPEFGHSIVELAKWLPNSQAFVLKLGGWDDPHGTAVADWTCLFNVESKSFTIDKNNHGKVVRGP